MNTELKQLSDIVIRARKALHDGQEPVYQPDVLSVLFEFAPRSVFQKPVAVASVQGWFHLCKERGLEDIKMIVPTQNQNRDLLGFANTSQGVIVCYWKKGKASAFYPSWIPDRKKDGWRVVYREHPYKNADKPTFPDRTEDFKCVLTEIRQLALDIDFPDFAQVFDSAYEELNDGCAVDDNQIPAELPDNLRGIYYAVSTADVFGAMGSWNDSPPCYAHFKGLDEEYDTLSSRLLTQIRANLMYIINECWK